MIYKHFRRIHESFTALRHLDLRFRWAAEKKEKDMAAVIEKQAFQIEVKRLYPLQGQVEGDAAHVNAVGACCAGEAAEHNLGNMGVVSID